MKVACEERNAYREEVASGLPVPMSNKRAYLERALSQSLAFPPSSRQRAAPILSRSDDVDDTFPVLVSAFLHLTLANNIPIVHLVKSIP